MLPEAEIQAVKDRIVQERQAYAAEPEETTTGRTGFDSKVILDALAKDEAGDAGLFVEEHRGKLTYDHAAGLWHLFKGHHWEPDLTEQALSRVGDVADIYLAEMKRQAWARIGAEKAGQIKTADAAAKFEKALARRARDLHTVRRRQSVLHLARAGADTLGISGDEWDRDLMSLAVQNGVVDLRTGNFREGKPEDYFKTFAPTPWEGLRAPCPTFDAFLYGIFNGDLEIISFVKRLLGYAISGKTTEAVLAFLWGAGRNGKTVLLQTIAEILGNDLSGPIDGEMLLESRFKRPSGGPSSDLLYLRGKRLTWLSETNENRRINSGKVKLLTGGDLITGRAPYAARQVTFKPTHKIFFLTNHLPKADAQDAALWRRVLLIPFNMAFVPDPDPNKPNERLADLDLPEKLRAEQSGILAWLVQGCLEWQRQGLKPPDSVSAATREYQDAEDVIKLFLQDRCSEGPGQTVQAGQLYKAYQAWCDETGEKFVTGKKFWQQIDQAFDSTDKQHVKYYIGIGLL